MAKQDDSVKYYKDELKQMASTLDIEEHSLNEQLDSLFLKLHNLDAVRQSIIDLHTLKDDCWSQQTILNCQEHKDEFKKLFSH